MRTSHNVVWCWKSNVGVRVNYTEEADYDMLHQPEMNVGS